MFRNLKVCSVTALVLAIGAVTAQTVQAAEFHKPAEPITITMRPDGTGKAAHQVFDFAGGALTCGGAIGEATVEGEEETFTEIETSLLVEVKTCSFFGAPAEVKLSEKCRYVYHANKTADIRCAPGEELTINVPALPCHISVPPQAGKAEITYTNINEKKEITVSPFVPGTKYTSKGAGCPKAGTFEDGIYTTGNVILSAEKKGTVQQVPLFWK